MGTQLGAITRIQIYAPRLKKLSFEFFYFLTIKCPPNCTLETQLGSHLVLSLRGKKPFFP